MAAVNRDSPCTAFGTERDTVVAAARLGNKSAAVEDFDDNMDGSAHDGGAHLAQLADAAEEADDAEGAHEADEPGGDRAVGQVQDRHAHHHHVQPVLRPQRGGRWGLACAGTQKDRSDGPLARAPRAGTRMLASAGIRGGELLFMPLRSPEQNAPPRRC